jgi:hypothetical protein
MDIGIIGAGRVAQAFARKAIDVGHRVLFSNSRGAESLAPTVARFGPLASAVSAATAAKSPIVLLAVPWPKIESALSGLPGWHGQILIDPSNAFVDGTPAQGIVDFGESSSSEHVAELASGARVVKAMNTLFMNHFAAKSSDPHFRRALFVSGDDLEARQLVADLFESFGFAPVDLGSLKVGGKIQAIGGALAGHDFFLPWPAPRSFPAINGEQEEG